MESVPTFAWNSCPPSRGIRAHDGVEYAAGAHILSAPWGEHGFGGVEIEFEFDSEGSWAVGRMLLWGE